MRAVRYADFVAMVARMNEEARRGR